MSIKECGVYMRAYIRVRSKLKDTLKLITCSYMKEMNISNLERREEVPVCGRPR